MNLLEITVIKVIIKPHKTDNGLWSTTVLIDCYGVVEEKTITDTKEFVKKYKKGYTWLV